MDQTVTSSLVRFLDGEFPENRQGKLATHVGVGKVFDAPPVATRKLHDISLQPSFGSITCNRLAPHACGGFVVGADPRGQALVGHLPCDIAVYRSDELVMKVLLFAIGGDEDRVYPFGELGLVETAWMGS